MSPISKSSSAFDGVTSRMVGDVLLWCITELAESKDQVRQTYDNNRDLFDRLNESDKQRLREAWAVALEMMKNG